MRIECFMSIPSHYQGDFYRELSKICSLKVWFENNITEDRIELGWDNEKYGFDSDLISNCDATSMDTDIVYFINGIPGSLKNLYKGIRSKNNVLAQAEMPYQKNHKLISKIVNRLFRSIMNSRNIPFLGIGEDVRKYYKLLGLKEELVFPYAYFCKKSIECKPDFKNPIVYVGQLIKRKGVDLLLEAFSKCDIAMDRGLIIIGDGPLKDTLVNYAKDLGISNSIIFRGTVNNKKIANEISNSSCLVLPSNHDGWGVVVNEAINCNIPTIVSDKCGSSELVSQGAGIVFQNNSTDSLLDSLNLIFNDKTNWENYSDNCETISNLISPKSGAEYFLEIINYLKYDLKGTRPKAPWLN